MDNYVTEINHETGEINPQFIYNDTKEDSIEDDKYYYQSTDNQICRILSHKLSDPYLCKIIVKLKNNIEENASKKYHIEMWNLVGGAYFKGVDRFYHHGSSNDRSYILNMASKNTEYHVYKDY